MNLPRKRRKKKSDDQYGTLLRLSENETSAEDQVVRSQFANTVELSQEQDAAYKLILQWLSASKVGRKPVFTLGGYAGTGKTTLLGALAADLCRKHKVAFCAFTGKAASVLERSLKANGVSPSYCGTIHRLIYRPIINSAGDVMGWAPAEELDYDLVVVDEASMVSSSILDDMQEYGIPILAVGDHGQLPPVGEEAGLMQNPDARLETVRRQALDNPVVALSVLIREGGDWRGFVRASADARLQSVSQLESVPYIMDRFDGFVDRSVAEDPLVLCATNKTRVLLNKACRSGLRTEDVLVPNERVICLKNAYLSGMLLANGFRGRITSIGQARTGQHVKANAVFPDQGIELKQGVMVKAQFGLESVPYGDSRVTQRMPEGLLFDYGYALTVHKAQGSQAENVILYVERFGAADEFKRWLYTGVTRCTTNLVLAF